MKPPLRGGFPGCDTRPFDVLQYCENMMEPSTGNRLAQKAAPAATHFVACMFSGTKTATRHRGPKFEKQTCSSEVVALCPMARIP